MRIYIAGLQFVQWHQGVEVGQGTILITWIANKYFLDNEMNIYCTVIVKHLMLFNINPM